MYVLVCTHGDVLPAMQPSPSRQTNTMHKHLSASTLVVQWLARPRGMHEIMSSNLEIMHDFANRFFKENMAYRAIDIVFRGIYSYVMLYTYINQVYKYILLYTKIHMVYTMNIMVYRIFKG